MIDRKKILFFSFLISVHLFTQQEVCFYIIITEQFHEVFMACCGGPTTY